MWNEMLRDGSHAQPASIAALAPVAGIWAAVVVISVFAPDLVSGSEHQHLPVVAFGTWVWGAIATRSTVAALLRLDASHASGSLRSQLGAVVASVWAAAAVIAVFGPVMVTGSDPTRLPIAAMLAPVAATVLTTGVCDVVTGFLRRGPVDV